MGKEENTRGFKKKKLAVVNAAKELRWTKVRRDNTKVISNYQGNKFHSALSTKTLFSLTVIEKHGHMMDFD